jgi:hypothetical protein
MSDDPTFPAGCLQTLLMALADRDPSSREGNLSDKPFTPPMTLCSCGVMDCHITRTHLSFGGVLAFDTSCRIHTCRRAGGRQANARGRRESCRSQQPNVGDSVTSR